MVLEREQATYEREKARLLAEGEQGRFALIHGDEVVSVWDTYRDASQAGSERFDLGTFMIRQILKVERPGFLTPFLVPNAPVDRTADG
jgi:hypothetical protein